MDKESEKVIAKIKNEADIFEKARLLSYLIKNKELRIIDLAKELNCTSSYLCHILRLLKLPELVIDGYYSKEITISHLFIVSRLIDQKDMIELYEKILGKNFTVAQTEAEVRELLHQVKTEGIYLTKEEKNKFISTIKEKNKYAQIEIIQTRIKGRLCFEVKGSARLTSDILRKLLEKIAN